MADVSIDVSWIESAITNLVANALRLTAPDTAVQVRVVDDGDSVSVAVRAQDSASSARYVSAGDVQEHRVDVGVAVGSQRVAFGLGSIEPRPGDVAVDGLGDVEADHGRQLPLWGKT